MRAALDPPAVLSCTSLSLSTISVMLELALVILLSCTSLSLLTISVVLELALVILTMIAA